DDTVFTVCLDLCGPLKEILEQLVRRVRNEKERRNPEIEKTIRKRFTEYELYLRVFDLRTAGKNRKEIAEAVLPKYCADHEKTVTDYMAKAKRLILRAEKGIW